MIFRTDPVGIEASTSKDRLL